MDVGVSSSQFLICSGSANRLLGIISGSVWPRMFDTGALLGVGDRTLNDSGGGVVVRRMGVGGRSLGGEVKILEDCVDVLRFLGVLLCVPKSGNSVSKSTADSSAT